MRLRRLRLSGFKSFVEAAELRIEPGLTGVVGPNGCGKSNLLEALRWVMGEASPSSLRGGGMEDVIFAGTALRPARQFAEVSLLIESDEEYGRGERREREVSRRIERGSGSAYRIDGRDVRQKDVALLFADAATGAHSPALVSQGRIGAVIAARPSERRQMLEEAAGIAGLHARRRDAEQKLRATQANLERLDEIMADQQSRAATLRRQARSAERYRQLSARIRAAEARLLYARWAEADQRAAAAAGQAEQAAAEVGALQASQDELAEQHERARQDLARQRLASTALRDEAGDLAQALADSRARRDTVARRLGELDRLAESLAAEEAREQALNDDAVRLIALLDAEQAAIAERLEQVERSSERLVAELAAAQVEALEAETALARLLGEEAAARADRRLAEAAVALAAAQLERVSSQAEQVSAELAALADAATLARALDEAILRKDKAVADAARAQAALALAERQRAQAAAEREAAESAAAVAKAAEAAARAESTALAQGLAAHGEGVTSALTVEPGYERALAAALGDDLGAPVGGDGQRRWSGSAAQPSDPPLDPSLACLARFVAAPPELGRRLAQIGVADEDRGQPLAVGQRLVTMGGRLRRWDGFVEQDRGAVAAERLLRANRVAALAAELPLLEAAAAEAQAARDALARRIELHQRSALEARVQLAACEAAQRGAVGEAEAAASALDRLAAERAALTERSAELAMLLASARETHDAAALAELPAETPTTGAIEAARARTSSAGASLAVQRAESAMQARTAAADGERLAAARSEQAAWRERAAAAHERLGAIAIARSQQMSERAELASEPDALVERITELEGEFAAHRQQLADAVLAERDADAGQAELAGEAAAAAERLAQARETRAAAGARAEAELARRSDYARSCGERFECQPPLLPEQIGFDPASLVAVEEQAALVERLAAERERLGPVNLVAERELAEIDQALLGAAADRDELGEAVNRLRGSIGSLNREGRVRLLEAFGEVDRHFRDLFATLFDGGQAHLALIESDDPLEAGLEIMAQPPGKKLTSLTLLSGGEQALTAIALIFALFLTNPAPVCVLDEVDAPLDDANVERFCDLLARISEQTDTRYLIVTHNPVTMSRMDRLYGVTMIEQGVSQLVSVDLQAQGQAQAAQ